MNTLIIAVLSFVGFIVAYHTYGKWLARKIFGLDTQATVPSQELRDDVDYVPTKKEIIFGQSFHEHRWYGAHCWARDRCLLGDGCQHCCGLSSDLFLSVPFMTLARSLFRCVTVDRASVR